MCCDIVSLNGLPDNKVTQRKTISAGVPRQTIGFSTYEWMIEIGSFLLRTESELVLKSRWVIPTKLVDAGFTFSFPDWPTAARDLVTRQRRDGMKGASD